MSDVSAEKDAAHEWAQGQTLKHLRGLAHDMPYKGESSRTELIQWLLRYAPDRLPASVIPPGEG